MAPLTSILDINGGRQVVPTDESAVRVGGSGFTVFHWMTKPIAFAQQISHTTPEPVGAGATAIQPMDKRRPVQVITPAAAGMGTITLQLYDLYNSRVWERLTGLAGTTDLVDIFQTVAASPEPIYMTKTIQPPVIRGSQASTYIETYHNCVITNLQAGEQIDITTMEVLKQITVAYTHMTTPPDGGSVVDVNLPWIYPRD